ASAHVLDRDAAVGGADGQLDAARHLKLEGDRPVPVAPAPLASRTLHANAAAGSGQFDLGWDRGNLGVAVGIDGDPCPELDVWPVPSADAAPAVSARIAVDDAA